jgi:nitrogen fixation/metabolism regulation signal transduction histidine kinase
MKRIMIALPLLATCGLAYIATRTRPDTVGPAVMLLVFILLYLLWVGIFMIVTDIFLALGRRFKGGTHRGRSNLRPYYIASIIAFIPVLILAIQSVNQLTIRDLLLAIGLAALAIFYVIKRT